MILEVFGVKRKELNRRDLTTLLQEALMDLSQVKHSVLFLRNTDTGNFEVQGKQISLLWVKIVGK